MAFLYPQLSLCILPNAVPSRVCTKSLPASLPLPAALSSQTTSREFETSKTILHPANLHPKREGASLSAFMATLPTGALMSGLQRHLPSGALSCERVGEDVWLLTLRCIHLGPRVWGLWLQPRIVLWLRKKARKIEAEAHMCGLDGGAFVWSGGENARICVEHLDVRSSLTWIEESITHLRGDYVPVVLLNSKMRAGLEVRARGGWARLLPAALLSSLGRRAAGKALQELQEAAAEALVEEYEAWRVAGRGVVAFASPPPPSVDEVDGGGGGDDAGGRSTFQERFAWQPV